MQPTWDDIETERRRREDEAVARRLNRRDDNIRDWKGAGQ